MTKKQTKNTTAGSQENQENKPSGEAQVENNVKTEGQAPAPISPEERVKELEDRNLRLLAEMQNMRVRQQKDLKDTREYAVTGFANDMIALSEDIYRAREAIPDAQDELYKKILEGLDLTIDELKRVFAKHGIERITPQKGDKFDYQLHQAIAQMPTDEVEDGGILNMIAAGYKIKERILRPAMVAVAKKAENNG